MSSSGVRLCTNFDQDRRTKELKIKEALHIFMTPSHQRLNRDEGLELPGMRKREGGPDSTSGPTSHLTVWCIPLSSAIILHLASL